jgi:hypothetical protein
MTYVAVPPATVFEDNGTGFIEFFSTRETMRVNVIRIMRKNEEARNSDNFLTVTYLAEILNVSSLNTMDNSYSTLPEGIFAAVTRTRQLIQAEGLLLPTDPKVRENRGITEIMWREWLPLETKWKL